MSDPRPSTMPGRPLSDAEHAALVAETAVLLATSHLFKSLDDAGREAFLASGLVVSFPKGTRIITQGEAGDHFYVLLRGRARVRTEGAGGSVQLAELTRGACFGEVSVLTGAPRTASIDALDDVDAVAYRREVVDALLEEYPKVKRLLEALVGARARDTIDKIVR